LPNSYPVNGLTIDCSSEMTRALFGEPLPFWQNSMQILASLRLVFDAILIPGTTCCSNKVRSMLNSQHAVYVGSFDPMTLGHVDVVRRGARIFEQLTVGIGINPEKNPLFTSEERLQLIQDILSDLENVKVACFSGLTVDFVKQQQAGVMLRGIRTLSDIETEFTMTLANHALEPEIETVFLMASERYSHISSSLIKQIAQMGRESAADKLEQFIPEQIIKPLLAKFV